MPRSLEADETDEDARIWADRFASLPWSQWVLAFNRACSAEYRDYLIMSNATAKRRRGHVQLWVCGVYHYNLIAAGGRRLRR